MELTLCLANTSGNEKNCIYPNKVVIASGDDLRAAVKFDHVCAEFKNNKRSIS